MSASFTCDACGATVPADRDYLGRPIKPLQWYARTPIGENEIHACSRPCMTKIDQGDPSYDPLNPWANRRRALAD